MLSELGKMINKQIEFFSSKNELQKSCVQEKLDLTNDAEKIIETSEASEISKEELKEGTKILEPNIELIKTQSLESVKQNNLEKTQLSAKENNEFRELTEEEKQYLREAGLSEKAIENIRVDAEGNYYLKCRNEELAGKKHEITGVKYIEKTITVGDIKIIVVAPEFPAIFECQIPREMWEKGDKEIFKYCTEKLGDYLEANPEMKSLFNDQQLEQIMNGEPYIKGYTWHHSEIPGQMQLVETKTHALSGHTGDNLIWCGGIR